MREVVAHVSHMGEARDRLLRQLYDTLASTGITPGLELAIYHLQAYTAEEIDMSLAVEVAADTRLPENETSLKCYPLPAIPLAASIVYHGDMWHIPDVVANLYRWLGMNGYTSAGAYRELHLFGRELELFAVDPPGEAVIEILVPVEKL